MTLEEVKVLLECAAIVIAGAWAVYGFVVFRQRAKAIADLRQVEAETRKIELECRRQAVVGASIVADVHPATSGTGFWITATVTLQNTGSRDTHIRWDGEPPAFHVRRVAFAGDGLPTFGDAIELRVRKTLAPEVDSAGLVLRAGATERITFAVQVAAEGLYRLAFRGVVAPAEQKVSAEAGAQRPTAWTATQYCVVRRSSAAG